MKDLVVEKSGFLDLLGLDGLAHWLGLRVRPDGAQRLSTHPEVEIPGHGRLRLALSLDFTGDTCLRTNLVTKRALAEAAAGAVIEIVTDNLSSVETIPFMSPNYDGVHLATVHAQSCWRIYIRKGGDSRGCAAGGSGQRRG